MAKKNERGKGHESEKRFVYSTDPNFSLADNEIRNEETLLPGQQKLQIRLDTKQRAGKAVTLVQGFVGKESDLEILGKKLKTYCGTGGSVKDGAILIQGDQRVKLLQWLLQNGYAHTKQK